MQVEAAPSVNSVKVRHQKVLLALVVAAFREHPLIQVFVAEVGVELEQMGPRYHLRNRQSRFPQLTHQIPRPLPRQRALTSLA